VGGLICSVRLDEFKRALGFRGGVFWFFLLSSLTNTELISGKLCKVYVELVLTFEAFSS
jgi:hypothetical protein